MTKIALVDKDIQGRQRTIKYDLEVDKNRLAQMGMAAGQVLGESATRGASNVASSSMSVFSSLGTSLTRIGVVGVAGLGAIVPVMVELTAVAAALASALALIPAALAGVGLGAGVLIAGLSGITDAYEAVSGAAKDAGKDAKDHARTVQSASRSVSSAQRSLTSAVKSEESAQKDVAKARRDALRELQDINDELRSGAIDETQAQLDLAKAREELATGTFESSIDYQQAQLNVIKAEDRLKRSHEDNIDLETEVADKRAKGVDGADAVVAAEERLATAQQNTADAQAALADAQTRLADAQTEVSTSAQKAADAMAGLSPNAQALVNSLVGLQPLWEDFRNSLQDPLTADLGAVLTNTVNAVLPAIQPGLVRIAGAFNDMFKQIGVWLQDPENLAMMERIVNNIATAFEKLEPVVGPVLDAFGHLVDVGSGFLPEIADSIARIAESFGDWITKAAESGELEDFMQRGLDAVKQVLPLIPQMVEAFFKLAPIGEKLLPDIVRIIEKTLDLIPRLMPLFVVLGANFGTIEFMITTTKNALDIFGAAWGFQRTVIETAIGGIKTAVGVLKDKIADMIPDSIKVKWDTFWNGLHIVVDAAVDKVMSKMKELKEFLINLLPPWAQGLIEVADRLSNKTTPGTPVPAPPNPPSSGPSVYKDWYPGSPTPPPTPAGPPGAQPSSNEPGVPGLYEKSPGVWTSTDKAWADLIEAESGGRLGAIQGPGIVDVNTGGNEAQGLFQITPDTWRRNGGEEFAPTPNQASAQAQGIVAARILHRNPSGSDWGPVDRGEVAAPSVSGTPTPSVPSGVTPAVPGMATERIPYGLPAGTDIRQGAAGFPQWVYDLGAAFNVTPSTYAGHQEGAGVNQGIDWWGTTADLQRFAEYLEANPDLAEQVIFSNPETGEKTGMAMGQKVGPGTSQPNYYAANWAGHTKHVHTRFSQSAGPGGTAGTPTDSHVIALNPNIPPGQQKTSDAAKGMGEQLGKDIVSGMLEIFGFGDIFKDPTEFGIFKLFKSFMGIKPANKTGGPANSGSTNADTGTGTGNPLIDTLAQFIPGGTGNSIAADIAAWQPGGGNTANLSNFSAPGQFGPGGGVVDSHDMNITVNGDMTKPAVNTMDTKHLSATRKMPK